MWGPIHRVGRTPLKPRSMLATLFALRVVALASGGYAPRADPIIGLGRHLLGSDDAACSPGTHAQTCNATTSCEDCAPGYYCDGGASSPVACPAGTALASYGGSSAADCSACGAGDYNTLEGQAACTKCPAGYSCADAVADPVSATCRSEPGGASFLHACGRCFLDDDAQRCGVGSARSCGRARAGRAARADARSDSPASCRTIDARVDGRLSRRGDA